MTIQVNGACSTNENINMSEVVRKTAMWLLLRIWPNNFFN